MSKKEKYLVQQIAHLRDAMNADGFDGYDGIEELEYIYMHLQEAEAELALLRKRKAEYKRLRNMDTIGARARFSRL